jgi:hypothetical protein
MNFKTLISSLLVGKVGSKILGPIGRRFGLSPQKMTMIVTIGIPVLMKLLRSRKATGSAANVIKGKVRR